MTERDLAQNLKQITNQYEEFKKIAIHLKWSDCHEKHFEWYRKYPLGLVMSIYSFPENYVETHFNDAFVQCCISELAFNEEWDKQFFNTSESERNIYINNAEKSTFNPYHNVCTWEELRLKPVTADFLRKEIRKYTDANEPILDHQGNFLLLDKMAIIEIGGCYNGDSDYIAADENCIIRINCGIWD